MDNSPLTVEQLVFAYQRGPAELRKAVDGISPEHLRMRVGPGKWSVLEVVCHIADSEIVYAERIRRVIVGDNPTLFDMEPDDFEKALAYNLRDVDEELAVIESIRSQTGRILNLSPAETWERRGTHSTAGPLSVRQLVERVTGHIPHHIGFILEKRAALGG